MLIAVMIYVLNYLANCFYQSCAKDMPDRAGTSRILLSMFVMIALVNIYTLFALLLGSELKFAPAMIVSYVLAQLTVRAYARCPEYQQQLVRYAKPEPERLRLALTGAGVTLVAFLLPILLMYLAKPH